MDWLTAEDLHWLRGLVEGSIPVPMWAEWWRGHAARFEQRLGRTEFLRMKLKPREAAEQLLRLAGVAFTAHAPEVGPPSSEEYAVLSALLTHWLEAEELLLRERKRPRRALYCIQAECLTRFHPRMERTPSVLRHWMTLDALGQTARDDLLRKSTGSWLLEPRLTLPWPYRLVTREELDAVAEEERRLHPEAQVPSVGALGFRFSETHLRHFGDEFVMGVSRVGFGAQGREALACVSQVLGTPMGHVQCSFLRHEEAGWRVVDSMLISNL